MTNSIAQTEGIHGRTMEASERILAIQWAADCTLEEAVTFFENSDWKAYTDEEAEEACKKYIQDNLWTFSAGVIVTSSINYGALTAAETDAAIKAIETAQSTTCESLNGLMYLIIGGEDGLVAFATDVVRSDGRGAFLSHYDGEEHCVTVNGTGYNVYRRNCERTLER